MERDGPDLLARLVQSNLAGAANLEAATGKPFADLYRDWTTATAFSADLHGPYGGRLLCGPRIRQVALDGGRADVDLAGTSAAYLLLHSAGGARSRITMTADAEAELQVSLIRLPEGSGASPSTANRVRSRGTCRLKLTAQDGEVTLEDAAWERRMPLVNRPEDARWRPDRPAGEAAQTWFGSTRLKAGETRTSGDVPLPADADREPVLFKVLGRDAKGRAVAAWEDD